MKKIDVLDHVCEDYNLDSTNYHKALSSGAIIPEACATCFYNLFTYCHFDDREDPIVIRALEGNPEAQKIILDDIRSSEGQTQ